MPEAPPPPPPERPAYPHMDIPVLHQGALDDARLFASRDDLLRALGIPQGGVIGEIGVGLGHFSAVMLGELQPARFVAFDTFDLHALDSLWGHAPSHWFGEGTHRAFYEARFAADRARMVFEEGFSQDRLAEYPDASFDLLYIDGDHRLEGVQADTDLATVKIKPGGVLIFNDYIMADHILGGAYGVVPVVNALALRGDFKIVGFGLQQHLFCDIALRRMVCTEPDT